MVNVKMTIRFTLKRLITLDINHSNHFNLLVSKLEVGSSALLYKCKKHA